MKSSERLVSLDAFRGFTIAAMILVNNPGDWDTVYPPLLHAHWEGWTPTDLIFPSFIFIVGVSLVFSLSKRLDRDDRGKVYLQILRRTAVIFLLGILLNLFPSFNFGDLRVAGVLQRIALVYLAASLIVLNTTVRAQAWICGSLLVGYWLAMGWVPVPGFGAGIFTPEGNLAAYLDSIFLPGRMWEGTWDPEGLLSTIPSVATALLGVLTGHWLRSGRPRAEIGGGMFVAGWALILLGLLWSIWFPIIKGIWTSSFVLFTAGASLEALAVCYWLVDVRGRSGWAYPGVVYGMNAITVYVASDVLTGTLYAIPAGSTSLWNWAYQSLFTSWMEPRNASLAMAAIYVVLWFAVMNILFRRKIFIKV